MNRVTQTWSVWHMLWERPVSDCTSPIRMYAERSLSSSEKISSVRCRSPSSGLRRLALCWLDLSVAILIFTPPGMYPCHGSPNPQLNHPPLPNQAHHRAGSSSSQISTGMRSTPRAALWIVRSHCAVAMTPEGSVGSSLEPDTGAHMVSVTCLCAQ